MSLLLKSIEKELDREQRIPTVFDLQAQMWIERAAERWEVEMEWDDALEFAEDIQKRLEKYPEGFNIWNGGGTIHCGLLLRIFLIDHNYFPGRGMENLDGFAIARANYARSKIFNTNLKHIQPIDMNAMVVSDWHQNN